MSFPWHPERTPDGLSSSTSRKGGNLNTGRTRGFHSLPPKYRYILLLARGYQPTGELIKSIAPVFVFVLLFAPRCGNEQARHLPSACFSSSSQLAGALIAHTDTHTAVKNGGIGLSAVLAMLSLCSVHGQTQQQNEAVPSPVLQPLVM